MSYEVENQGRPNEVQRVTSPVAPQRDPAAVPLARVEKIGGADRVTIRTDGSNPNTPAPAPRDPVQVRTGGERLTYQTHTGEMTVESSEPPPSKPESVFAGVPRSSLT